jgi:2-(1,2-epoxy-1,2-dihydrophenyl)acetyl-CoA isomerase
MTDETFEASPINYAVSHGVASIELHRPAASNAVDLRMAVAFREAVDAAGSDPTVRAIVVTGAGARFCAGGDVVSMIAAADRAVYVQQLAETLDGSLQRLDSLDKPVIAGVHGAVAGAGLAVMLSCDVVLAATSTRFVAAYSGVGLTPDCGLSWLLPRAVGQQRALLLLVTERRLVAAEALDWGLVSELVPDHEVIERATALARICADGPAGALGQARRLARSAWGCTRAETGADESRTIGRAVVTADAERLLGAFASR